MSDNWIHPEEINAIEEDGRTTVVYDVDGNPKFSLPGINWDKKDVARHVSVANLAYQAGIRVGKAAVRHELYRTLGVYELIDDRLERHERMEHRD